MDRTDPNSQAQPGACFNPDDFTIRNPLTSPTSATASASTAAPQTQPPTEPPPAQPALQEPQVQSFGGQSPTKNSNGTFRAIFLLLLILTMISAGATTYILLNWNQPTQTTTNADIIRSTPTLTELQNTQVDINPFSDEAIQDNPFAQTATDSTNIFNEFDEEDTSGGAEYQNPF